VSTITPHIVRTRVCRRVSVVIGTALVAALLSSIPVLSGPAAVASAAAANQPEPAVAAAAAGCSAGQSGAAVPRASRGTDAVRTMMGVAQSMGVPVKGQIIAVMVMLQESSIRNLANDGTSPQANWPAPGRDYWLSVTKLSLKYPHDKFGVYDGAHDTDSIGLYQQRPAWGWGNYGASTGLTDPEGVVQRLLDPRWESMAFFGGPRSAAPNSGLLDIPGWQNMALTDAAEAVQGSTRGDLYAKWETLATDYVQQNQGAPALDLPWYPGGGTGALTCTAIPSNPALGEAGRNPVGRVDIVALQGNRIRVAGWAFDPDAINGVVAIHVYDTSRWGTAVYTDGLANSSRPDVARVYNLVGNFGYGLSIPWTGPGQHSICAYAINTGRGVANPQLGCRTITVPGPIGHVDQVIATSGGRLQVTGWAADRQAPGVAEQVHIYVTGPTGTRRGYSGTYTGLPRSDVGRVHPWAGGNAGFRASVPNSGVGDNQVCVYAINVNPPRNNPLLGCRTVTVRDVPPIGHLDAVTVSGSTAVVRGWTFDRAGTSTSIPVQITVKNDAGTVDSLTVIDATGIVRSDVNRVYGITGAHGFSQRVDLGAGANSVCTYGVSLSGSRALLGCTVVQAAPAIGARGAAPTPGPGAAQAPASDSANEAPPVTTASQPPVESLPAPAGPPIGTTTTGSPTPAGSPTSAPTLAPTSDSDGSPPTTPLPSSATASSATS
jgi:hypothetical protein